MIRVRQMTLREIRLALSEPFTISSGTQKTRRILLVELTDADGATGWGECVAPELPNYLPETIDIAWLALQEWIAPRILDRPLGAPEAVHPLLEKQIRGHQMSKAAVEMAVWELAAAKSGVALSRLLGGTRDRVATGISIGIQRNPDELARKASTHLREGYRRLKLKIEPGADVAYVEAVREALGPDAPLMVDANNAYTLNDMQTFRRLDSTGLLMIEQPLAWDDRVLHAELQKELQTPICLDESITKVEHAREMIALGSGRILNIKPGRVGGFTSSIAIHDYCARHGMPVWCGGMLESGVGRAHNVALASLPNFILPGDISPSKRYWEQDIVTPEWTMSPDGMVDVPVGRPGMGVGVDMHRVDNLTVREEVLRGVPGARRRT
ncbi:MAG: o-succinylbenzoate synthase [Candidatus Krumholzibacteriia bacterium]